jgi:hypothetical protein
MIAGLTMLPGSIACHTSCTVTWPSLIETSAIAAVCVPNGEAMAMPRARVVPSAALNGPRFHPPERSTTALSRVVSRALPASRCWRTA